MSHFYATIPDSARRTVPTARGHKSTGVRTIAACWNGAIEVELTHVDGKDLFSVRRIPWQGKGASEDLAKGEL